MLEDGAGYTPVSRDDYFVMAFDSAGTVVFADEHFLEFLGRGAHEVGRFGVADLLDETDVAAAARVFGRMFADEHVVMPLRMHLPGTSGMWSAFHLTAWRVDLPDGSVLVAGVAQRVAAS